MTTRTALTAIALGLCVFVSGCGNSADKQAGEAKAAAERKTTEERAAADKKALAEKKAEEERAAAERKAAEERATAEHKAAEEKASKRTFIKNMGLSIEYLHGEASGASFVKELALFVPTEANYLILDTKKSIAT